MYYTKEYTLLETQRKVKILLNLAAKKVERAQPNYRGRLCVDAAFMLPEVICREHT